MSESMRRAWPHLRAALVLVHVIGVLVMASPSPRAALNRQAWESPSVRDEFVAWAGRLQRFGVEISPGELQARAWNVANSYLKSRDAIVDPWRPYTRYAGVRQPWRMFVAPQRRPAVLHVDLDRGQGFEPIYIARSGEYRWRGRQLDHDRMRAALFRYAWPHYRSSYGQLSRWIRRRAAQDFPDGIRVRIRMYRSRTPTIDQLRAGTIPQGEFESPRIYDLEGSR